MAKAKRKIGAKAVHDGSFELAKAQTRRITGDVRAIFGKNLNTLMMERGVSQSDLARHCFGTVEEKGFEVAAGRDRISKYLRGRSFPENATLAKIAEKLDCSLDELLPQSVRTALEGTTAPVLIVETSTMTGRSRVKLNGDFSEAFAQELMALVAKHRGSNYVRDTRRRKKAA